MTKSVSICSMVKSVPFFNYQFLFSPEKEQLSQIINDICTRGAFILQKDLVQFEENLAKFTGAQFALGTADGTEAITVALQAAGLESGAEVIFSSHTFIATAAAIHHAGGIPIPVECGDDHLIDPGAVEAAVTSKTKAIVPTQLNGRVCDMEALMSIAERHGLFIVEDAAQALGAKYKGRCAGTFGVAGTLSFYPAKSLGCFGDGGAILTNNRKLYDTMKLMRDHGRDSTGDVVLWGYNCRLDNLQAAILDYKLKSFDKVIARRRELASLYTDRLKNISALVLPPAPNSEKDHFDTFQNYEIEAEKRDDLQAHLKTEGIGTLVQWSGKAVHQFKKLGFTQSLSHTEKLFTRCIMLPMNNSLSNDDVEYVCDCIAKFYGAK